MSSVDLSNKDMYKMLNENMVEPEMVDAVAMEAPVPQMQPIMAPPMMPEPQPEKPKKMVRSIKGFFMFAIVVILAAAFIYFTVYRLGWGVKECMNKNFHDCAALLTPEIAPLAATGLIALL